MASAASTVGDPLKPLGLPLEVGDEYEFNYVRDNWICSLGPGSISNSPVPDTVPSGAYMRGQMVWPWAADWSDWFVAWRYEGVDYVANEVNVVFEEGTTDAYAQLIISGHGGTVVLQTSTSPPTYIVDTTGAATAPGMTLLLLGEPEVTWAEPNPI